MEFTLDVSSLAFLSGASGNKKPNGKPLGKLPIMSIENTVIYVPISHLSSACPVRVSFTLMGSSILYICREPSTNQLLFMQNKPNFQDTQMNVNIYYTKAYNNETASGSRKNKPNQTQFAKSPNECKLNFNKGLQKKRCFHRPNKQTQFLQMPKMDVNVYVIEDYENETAFRLQKNKPNSNPISERSK